MSKELSTEELNTRTAMANRLAIALKRRRMTKKDAETAAGIAGGTLTRLIKDFRGVELKTVLALLDVLQVNPEWLFTGRGPFDRSVVASLPQDPRH